MPDLLIIDTIFVPQGAEYKAVCRGLSRVSGLKPNVIPIPVGMEPVTKYLQGLAQQNFLNYPQSKILVMGICGSLSQRYAVGDIVLYQDCVYQNKLQNCDRTLTTNLHSSLVKTRLITPPIKALTSDRVICSATEKRYLSETFGTDVVDMEGFAILEFFSASDIPVAMLRVVSDDCHNDIPDLSSAISAKGSLQPFPLALALLRQPLAATRLIRGSLKGLKVLEQVTNLLFSDHAILVETRHGAS